MAEIDSVYCSYTSMHSGSHHSSQYSLPLTEDDGSRSQCSARTEDDSHGGGISSRSSVGRDGNGRRGGDSDDERITTSGRLPRQGRRTSVDNVASSEASSE